MLCINTDYSLLDTGSDSRKKAIIGSAVSDQRLFLEILRLAKTKFTTLTNHLAKRTLKRLDSYMKNLSRDLNIIRNENVVQESETDPDLRCRVEEVVGRVNDVMSDIEGRIGS